MPPAIESTIIRMGDTFSSHTDKATAIGIHSVFRVIPVLLPNWMSGAAIKATTAGRMPLNILSTRGLSLNCVKNKAINRMMIKEGRITPKPAARLPLNPCLRFPIKRAVFNATGPGIDCATASISTKSVSLSHFRLKTASFRISGIMAYPPPKVNAPILKKAKNNSM